MDRTETLWGDFLFLTKEMDRFLQKENLDMFFDLMQQREKLQEELSICQEDFRLTSKGQVFIANLYERNVSIEQKMQALLGRKRQQQNVVSTYDGYGANRPVGVRLDRKS